MPHEMSFCQCGREIHWPRGSRFGDTWRCYDCHRVWRLVPETVRRARPGYLVRSRRPEPRVVVIQMDASGQNPFLPPGNYPRPLPALPAPRRRGGLLSWLFGE